MHHIDARKMHLIQQMFFYISHYHRLFLTFSRCFGMLGFIKRIFGGIPRLPNHLSTSTMEVILASSAGKVQNQRIHSNPHLLARAALQTLNHPQAFVHHGMLDAFACCQRTMLNFFVFFIVWVAVWIDSMRFLLSNRDWYFLGEIQVRRVMSLLLSDVAFPDGILS